MNVKKPRLEIESLTNLSEDQETEGLDLQAGQTWTYPTNYSLREYQFNIIQEALLKNTLVSLPTGLGKTFIAAVVMYNFFRWYPKGKVIFMAPTKPLVKQQIDACYNITAIPKEATAELTGSKTPESRKNLWNEKRVFFITPQVLQNDLNILTELALNIKCIVIDEAHKAKGNHAYCEVLRKLIVQNKYFRVLALSATPGNNVNDVLEVINNLLIAHLEFRTDDSKDVVPYIFKRSLETVVVPLNEIIISVRDNYIKLLEKCTRFLIQHKVVMGNYINLTRGKIFMTMKNYQESNKQNRGQNYNEILKNLNICHTLYYAFELLLRHGLRSFLLFFEDRVDNFMLKDNVLLLNVLKQVRDYLGPSLNLQNLPDGSITGVPEGAKFGHPKFYMLRDITLEHFRQEINSETRVIVFCEYRETVMEAYGILSLSQPLIKPRIFMGKSSITQRQQLSVIRAFRDGYCNTLISTCIGEEGIDVGNVDLIICFDINNKSPIRMIQRMGRTGRKRQGRVVILVTEGREQQTLKECLIQKENLNHHILQSKVFENEMYKNNPRMIPDESEPKCNKIFITVKQDQSKTPQRKSKNLKDIFKSITTDNKNSVKSNVFDFNEKSYKLQNKVSYFDKDKAYLNVVNNDNGINFEKRIEKLRTLQSVGFVEHSSTTKLLVSLLHSCDSKKFNVPITQMPILLSQTDKTVKSDLSSINKFKQTDIRTIFARSSSAEEIVSTKQITDVPDRNEEKQLLNNKILAYLDTYESNHNPVCKLCEHNFRCCQFLVSHDLEFKISTWTEPDRSIFDSITEENILKFEQILQNDVENKNITNITAEEAKTLNENIDKTINKITFEESDIFNDTFGFVAPKDVNDVLKKCNLSDLSFANVPFTQIEEENQQKEMKIVSSVEANALKNNEQMKKCQNAALENNCSDLFDSFNFFNISALEEIFDNSFEHNSQAFGATILYSPEDCKNHNLHNTTRNKPNLSKLLEQKRNQNPENISDNNVDITSTSPILTKRCTNSLNKQIKNIEISDIADLSIFGLDYADIKQHQFNSVNHVHVPDDKENKKEKNDINLNDFCDNSLLEMFCDTSFQDELSKNSTAIKPLQNENTTPFLSNESKTINQVVKEVDKVIADSSDDVNLLVMPHNLSIKETNTQPAECIDLTLSEEDLSSSISPILKSYRYTQKSLTLSHKMDLNSNNTFLSQQSQNNDHKRFPKTMLALKKTNNSVNNCESIENETIEKEISSNNRTGLALSKQISSTQNQNNLNKFKLGNPSKKLNFTDDDDDDDFELESRMKTSWIRPKNENIKQYDNINVKDLKNVKKGQKKKNKQKWDKCPYVQLEVEVSDFDCSSDELENLDGSFDKSFVDDNITSCLDTTVMHAQYLESLKNTNRGTFKIPNKPLSNINVYSQIEDLQDNTYLNDTFCIGSQEVEPEDPSEMSELEVAESILEKQKKKKLKGAVQKKGIVKRRRIIVSSDSDSS
ncbi:hypothetical protein FQA39_LY13852 [Lamprigera yunnana]|nr:hypothetical protein FQA39_LY13852 [Lamprigera yunnana]